MTVIERKSISLMLLLELIMVNLSPISIVNLLMAISTFTFELCHPSHTKSSIIFSQALRMSRICPNKSDLVGNIGKLKDWFKERGYPENMVNRETKRALEIPSLCCSKTSEKSDQVTVELGYCYWLTTILLFFV